MVCPRNHLNNRTANKLEKWQNGLIAFVYTTALHHPQCVMDVFLANKEHSAFNRRPICLHNPPGQRFYWDWPKYNSNTAPFIECARTYKNTFPVIIYAQIAIAHRLNQYWRSNNEYSYASLVKKVLLTELTYGSIVHSERPLKVTMNWEYFHIDRLFEKGWFLECLVRIYLLNRDQVVQLLYTLVRTLHSNVVWFAINGKCFSFNLHSLCNTKL